MYSRRVVENNLARASAIIREREQLPQGWELRPSSPGQIAEMCQHFDGLLDAKGRLRRALTREEGLWQLCEATMCKLDFEYFATRYALIEDWAGRIVHFAPNRGQRILLREMARVEDLGWAQMWQYLKARQLGITTVWQILIAHRTFFWQNVATYTGSAEERKSKKMIQKLEFIWDNMPWWLRPRVTAARKEESMDYGDLNSYIMVQWGNQKGGWGRGDTPKVAHLSELASFANPAELVDASLLRAMHENPFMLLGLESTAEGIGDWWHQTWLDNVQQGPLAQLTPIFLPWYVGTDLYPTKGWLERRPVPQDWEVPEFVARHAEAARQYVARSPLLRSELGEGWEMPREQQWYYFVEYGRAKRKKTLHIFLQEMPATPDEAFQNANPTVFDIEELQQVRTSAQLAGPVGVFELLGRDVSKRYALGGWDLERRPVPLRCTRANGSLAADFALQPLKCDGWPDHDPQGRIYVWEWPAAGETYGIGVDPSEGVGQDRSVVTVVKQATPEHPDEQVAEFASDQVQAEDLWCWAFALAHLYTTRGRDGRWQWPRVVIEINIHGGVTCQTEMMKRGWSNFHVQTDFSKVGSKNGGAQPRARLDAIGWKTTTLTRPKIIGTVRSMIRDASYVVRSPWLASECATLEYNGDKARIEASQGNHDDRFFASGLVLTSWYDTQLYGSVPNAWQGERNARARLAERPAYLGGKVIGGAARQVVAPPGVKVDGRQHYADVMEVW